MSHPPCPSCGKELHLTPKRRGKCKACGETFLLNKKGQLFGPLVTEKQNADEIAFRELDYTIKVGVGGFRKLEAELEKQFGCRPPTRDVIWGLYQRVGQLLATDPQFVRSMAGFLADEGKDPTDTLRRAAEYDLKRSAKTSRELGSDSVEMSAGGCCQACYDALDAERVKIADALAAMPIPNPDCENTRGGFTFCNCCYSFVMPGTTACISARQFLGPKRTAKPPPSSRKPKYERGTELDDILKTPLRSQPKADPRLEPTPIKKNFWEKFWGDD